jgi:transposase
MIAPYYDAPTHLEGSNPMRGPDEQPGYLFSYVSAEARVPQDHPLRPVRALVDAALRRLSPRFDTLYVKFGRPSIAPEKLLRALLLQVLYTIRSERQLVEQLQYNLLFQWFVGLSLDDAIWDATTFTKNRDRLLSGEIADAFFQEVLAAARAQGLLSAEHFTVDGTLLESWASQKSFRPRGDDGPPPAGGNPDVDFRGMPRRNDTHQSTTDPDARLAKKGPGREAKLSYAGHVLMENRHGFVVDTTDACRWLRGDRCGVAHVGSRPGPAWCHGGRRQSVRRQAVCRRVSAHGHHPACRAEAPQCHRRPDHAPSRVRRQSAAPQTC